MNLFFKLLLGALLLRLVLLVISVTYPFDLNGDQKRYEEWAQTAHIHNLGKVYDITYENGTINNMPPGTLHVLSGTYETYIVIGKVVNKLTGTASGSIHWLNTYFLHAVMRVPSIVTDLLMGVLLYLLLWKRGADKALLGASLIWFNPVIIYNSTIWGQMDSLNNFFFLLSLFLVFKKKYIFSILAFGASLYIKLSLLPLTPFYLIFLYFHSQRQWKRIILGSIISIAAIIVATYPVNHEPINWLINKWPVLSSGEGGSITLAAFNFWWMVTCFPTLCFPHLQASDKFINLSLQLWAYGAFALSAIPLIYIQVKKSEYMISKKYIFLILSLAALSVFLFMPRMHDRYLYPFFPLFAAFVVLCKNTKRYLIIFIIFSVLHFANLIASWYFTRMPIFYSDILYSLNFRWIISALTVASGLYLYVISFKLFRKAPVE